MFSINFLNYYGDSVQYSLYEIWEYENAGGDFVINGITYSKHTFSKAVKFPYNKGYDEEKMISLLYPFNKSVYDEKIKMWLIL